MTLGVVICAAVLNSQAVLDQKISPDFRATRVPLILKEIEQKAHVRLECEPRFTNEILILRAKDVTVNEVMQRIAGVCNAGRERTKEGFILKRAGYVERELQQLDVRLRAANIRKAFDSEAATLARFDTPEKRATAAIEGYRSARTAANQGDPNRLNMGAWYHPSHQLYLKLLMAIGPDTMAAQPIGARVPYASPANRVQRPLPPALKALLAELDATGEAVRQSFSKEQGLPKEFSYWFNAYFKPFRVAKTIMVVTNDHTTTFAYMMLYDQTGDILTSSSGLLVSQWFEAPQFEPPGELKEIPYSADASYLQACISEIQGPEDAIPSDKSMPEATLASFLNPEERDPLSYHISDGFLGLAEQLEKPIVGRITDEIWRFAGLRVNERSIKPATFLRAAAQAGNQVVVKDGWLTVEAINPAQVERLRTKRDSLGRWMRASWAAKRTTIEEECRLQYENDGAPYYLAMPRTYRHILKGLGVAPAVGSGFMPARLMALLGSFSQGQWRALKSGEPFHLNLLTAHQKQLFAKVVPIASSRDENANAPTALMRNPSECIPFGPTEQTILRFVPDRNMVVAGFGEGLLSRIPMNAEGLGGYLASHAFNDKNENFRSYLPLEMVLGTRTGYKWELELIPGIVYGPAEFYEGAAMQPQKRTFDQLPEAFRVDLEKSFRARLDELKKTGG